jgi:hypothetical protein
MPRGLNEGCQGQLPQKVFERHGETFARLLGRDVPWMFDEEIGPDYRKIAKQTIANLSWHS